MKKKIIATDTEHLKILINEEIKKYGNKCDLNHINISKITKLKLVFSGLKFNGDISKWDVSNVTHMDGLFFRSAFNGDLSKWNVSNVTSMMWLFSTSQFDGDISNWNVSNARCMSYIFHSSPFCGDLSNWRPLKLQYTGYMYHNCKAPIPYWLGDDNEKILEKIQSYDLFNKMNHKLNSTEIKLKKMKI